jgi:hypothetical protein
VIVLPVRVFTKICIFNQSPARMLFGYKGQESSSGSSVRVHEKMKAPTVQKEWTLTWR